MSLEALGTGERAEFRRVPMLGGIELLSATFTSHSYARHAHDGYAIGVISAGAERFYYRGRDHLAACGAMVALDPDEVHDGSAAAEGGWTYRMSYVPPQALLAAAQALDPARGSDVPTFRSPVLDDPPLSHRFLALHQAMRQPATGRLALDAEALALFAALLSRHAAIGGRCDLPRPSRSAIDRVREALDHPEARSLSLDALAALAGWSPLYLIRAFRKATGFTPHAYQRHRRVQEAARRLRAGEPIPNVAAATGFADQSHLTRCFKRVMGVTPGLYRHRNR